MRSRRIGTDDHDHIGMHYGIEILRACGLAQGLLESETGRRMAHARAGVHIVLAKNRTHELLHQIGFFVGTTR